ncbi:hypothetical protein [Scytonema sp. PCC 10023]|uniref:hypothetical protein n=1 Tax=Scytonema sp. PCC 10023 TaxID=1680591 RepID=UPI0039C6C889
MKSVEQILKVLKNSWMACQQLFTNSLDDVVPNIAYFTKQDICSTLGISISTLARYRDDLIGLKIPGFEWTFYSTVCDRHSVEILHQYTQLVRMLRKEVAKENIKQHMETFWREYDKRA